MSVIHKKQKYHLVKENFTKEELEIISKFVNNYIEDCDPNIKQSILLKLSILAEELNN